MNDKPPEDANPYRSPETIAVARKPARKKKFGTEGVILIVMFMIGWAFLLACIMAAAEIVLTYWR